MAAHHMEIRPRQQRERVLPNRPDEALPVRFKGCRFDLRTHGEQYHLVETLGCGVGEPVDSEVRKRFGE
jgi:hypothetical protein